MIDQAAVSRIINALHSLKCAVGNSSGAYKQVWANGIIESLKNRDYWFESPKVVLEARSTLHDLENARNVLAGLSASLEETIVDIEKHIRPFELRMGLPSIPDELLSAIFENGLGGYEDIPTLSKDTLSLVCRRFRRVVLNTPRLWSRIKHDDTMPYVRACLERSKSVGLSIRLSFTQGGRLDRDLSLLSEVTPHSSRWEHLRVLFSLRDADIADREKILQSAIFLNLQLPSLHSLSLDYGTARTADGTLANEDLEYFYQSWEMPNLRSLDSSIIPKPFIAPKLSSVKLGKLDLSESLAVGERFQDFLNAFPDLEELDLAFSGTAARDYPRSGLAHLPGLTSLRIGAFPCQSSDVRPFMIALRAPKLRKLEIEMLAPTTNYDRDHCLESFFPLEVYPSLEDLSLEFILDDREEEFHLPFEKFPELHTLSMDTPNLVPSLDLLAENNVSALRTLKIASCSDTHLYWLEDLMEKLTENGPWRGFKRLVVSSAPNPLSVCRINTLYGEEDTEVIWR